MKRIFVIALGIFVALALPAAGQKPDRTLTITATPTTVKFGGTVTLAGKLGGSNVDNRSVRVEQDPFPVDSFATAGNATTNATGDWTLALKPEANTRYRASSGNVDSPTVDVMVRPAISLRLSDRTPRPGQRVRFSGRLCPEHDGASVALQRRSGTTWRTVRQVVLKDIAGTACSSFSRRLRVRRDGAYRAHFPGDAHHIAGSSRVRRANVG